MSPTDTPDGEESTPTTHYSLLGVSREASEDEIVAAYREKALEYHPDVSEAPRSDEYMTYLNRARETLLDPDKRAAYDAKLEEMGISPHSTSPPGQMQSARPPRRESMEYFIDRDRPVEIAYPDWPFADRVTNLAVRSWVFRAVLSAAVAVVVLDLEVGIGAIEPIVSPLSELLVAIAGIFAVDALRTARGYPRLEATESEVTPRRVLSSVRLGITGGALWTTGLLMGGDPHAFAGSVVLPLAAGGISVALLCRYFSLPRRLLLSISGAAGIAVALPFVAEAPVFVPADRFPTTELVGMILGSVLGLLALLVVGVAIVFGAPAVSRLAWTARCRSGATVVPQVWDAIVVVPIALSVCSLSAGLGQLPSLLDTYAIAAIESGLEPALAGLVLVWTVPIVAVCLAGRLWLGATLSPALAWLRTR
jgi:hypothetical protein